MQPLPMAHKPAPVPDAVLLANTHIATPCRADWNAMTGDTRSRFCGSCRKNVYNLSAMTAPEAAALIREKEGKLCVRYYERADGTVLTQDCPVGVAAVRRKAARVFAAGIVGFAALFSAATQWWTTDTGTNLFADRLHHWAERIHPTPPSPPRIMGKVAGMPVETPTETMGLAETVPEPPPAIVGAPEPFMGEAPPEIMGRMSSVEAVREVKGAVRVGRPSPPQNR